MKDLKLLMASMALTCLAMFPVASLADDDGLDVTMEVLDDLGQVDGVVLALPARDGEDGGDDGDGMEEDMGDDATGDDDVASDDDMGDESEDEDGAGDGEEEGGDAEPEV